MSITINKTTNEACFEINTKLYNFEKIIESASEFTESCWVYLDQSSDEKITVRIKPKSKDINPEEAANEFYNFILGLMKGMDDPV